jgi:hypothetical protein
MERYKFQVNMHFGKREISAAAMTSLYLVEGYHGNNFPIITAPNLPVLLRKIKTRCNIKLEQIVLEFQPE